MVRSEKLERQNSNGDGEEEVKKRASVDLERIDFKSVVMNVGGKQM